MKRLIKFGSIGLVIAGAIAAGGEQASAQNVLPEVFRTVSSTGRQAVVITGEPRTQIPIAFTGGNVARRATVRSNACGFAVLPNAAQYGLAIMQIGSGATFSPSIVNNPEAAAGVPTCDTIAGVPTPSFPLPVNIATKAPDGAVLLTGLTPSQVVDLNYSAPQNISRFVTLNACGFGSSSIPTGSGDVAVNSGNAASIPSLPIHTVACSNGALFGSGGTIASGAPEIFKDSFNNVYIRGASSTPFVFNLPGVANTRSATSDRCGGLTIGSVSNPTTGTLTINGISVDTSLIATGLKPRCLLSNGVYAFEAPPSNARLTNGQVFLVTVPTLDLNGALRINGFGDRSIVSIQATGNRVIRATSNACGIATLRSTAFSNNPDTTVSVQLPIFGTFFDTVANIPVNFPDRCTNGITQVRLN